MKSIKLIAPVLVLAISAIAGGLLIATAPEAERHVSPPKIPTVEVMPLRSGNYTVTITTQGTVSPRTQSTLIPEVVGRITSVSANFRPGGFFEAEDVLLTIDARDYENTVTMMRAELAQARLALDEEKARVEQARTDWKRLGGSTKPSDLVLRKPQLASKQAAVAAARARLRQAELDLERTHIKAPYAGRILEKAVDIGQYVSSGTVLATVYAVDYVEIRLPLTDEQTSFIDLPEDYRRLSPPDASSPAPGEAALETTIPAEPTGPMVTISARIGREHHRWTGTIVRTEGAVDIQSRQLFVVAQIDDPYAHRPDRPPLKVGRFVKAKIQGRELQGIFVTPPVAVRSGDEVWLVDENQHLERRRVEVIWRDTENVVIGDGLHEGESLVLTPLPYGVNGTRVRIAKMTEEKT
ncbi:MAG: efflux RND transporter periplasmic adaptor subunit [Gammaproteobacteria bacterium]|nr:efflux RND transporter periplasmic adaptor subunit [Gammaproteobacteria bacterium]NNJ85458.1 efflux RND transporter periplasmic adaptor subunit [Gammaproteobacteria bacterium]